MQPIQGKWTVKRGGVVEKVIHNIYTLYGLNQLAQSGSKNYKPPQFLALDGQFATLTEEAPIGSTQLTLSKVITGLGDSSLVINSGMVFFTHVVGNVYFLQNPSTVAYKSGDIVVRQVNENDTFFNLAEPIEYDPKAAPKLWPTAFDAFSPGDGQWTLQYTFSPGQINAYIATAGLCDSQQMGQGNLHSHTALNLDARNLTSELEIDIEITFDNAFPF